MSFLPLGIAIVTTGVTAMAFFLFRKTPTPTSSEPAPFAWYCENFSCEKTIVEFYREGIEPLEAMTRDRDYWRAEAQKISEPVTGQPWYGGPR